MTDPKFLEKAESFRLFTNKGSIHCVGITKDTVDITFHIPQLLVICGRYP